MHGANYNQLEKRVVQKEIQHVFKRFLIELCFCNQHEGTHEIFNCFWILPLVYATGGT